MVSLSRDVKVYKGRHLLTTMIFTAIYFDNERTEGDMAT